MVLNRNLFLLSAVSALAVGGAPVDVLAQPSDLVVSPGGQAPPATPTASPQPATNGQSPRPQGEGQSQKSGEGGSGTSSYYGDYLSEEKLAKADWRNSQEFYGVVPPTHTVVSGDTLWDLSAYYFNNPWSWPKVWKLNPEITDPHWIYPGNIIRLRDGAAVVQSGNSAKQGQEDRRVVAALSAPMPSAKPLQQIGYVDIKELKDAGLVSGAVDEKMMLSTGDSIYLSYPKGKIPKVGKRFAIYSNRKTINREGSKVGAYVEVIGELEITFAQKDKRARAVIVRSNDAIERGMHVGPLSLNFSEVTPTVNKKKLSGHVVELIREDTLIGTSSAIIVDRGSADGVEVGNRFLVIRRGDAYSTVMRPDNNVGQDDKKYPARAIGEVMIVQAGEKASIGVVTFSMHEFGVGDRVFMRKGQ